MKKRMLNVLWIEGAQEEICASGYREELMNYLNAKGQDVRLVHVSTFNDAWMMLSTKTWHLVVLDYYLPKDKEDKSCGVFDSGAGALLLRRLYKDIVSLASRRFPVVLYSAFPLHGDKEKVMRTLLKDGDAWLEMGIDTIDQFIEKLAPILDRVGA